MAFRTSTILLAAFLLTGCESLPWEERRSGADESGVTADPAADDVSSTEPVRSSPDSAGPRKPTKPLNPDELVGLNEEETLGRMGPPLDVRKEAPATVWSYQQEDCQLRLFFYPSLRDRRLQALTYEVTPSGDATMEGCLQKLGSYQHG
ncbi:hypothetical protein ACFOW6_07245 [Fodinicurvata halophila]|uniref:Uncharacterized protein n=1 Tax=Fodinicurvata halophila TaxID=1419723 RepID=A0ABV8UKJ8_9PROT